MAVNKPIISFESIFHDDSILESSIRIFVALIILLVILLSSSVFEVSYPKQFVELYAFPWWRFLVVCLVIVGAWWCPRVGVLLGLAAFFYLNDMHILTQSFRDTMPQQ